MEVVSPLLEESPPLEEPLSVVPVELLSVLPVEVPVEPLFPPLVVPVVPPVVVPPVVVPPLVPVEPPVVVPVVVPAVLEEVLVEPVLAVEGVCCLLGGFLCLGLRLCGNKSGCLRLTYLDFFSLFAAAA